MLGEYWETWKAAIGGRLDISLTVCVKFSKKKKKKRKKKKKKKATLLYSPAGIKQLMLVILFSGKIFA